MACAHLIDERSTVRNVVSEVRTTGMTRSVGLRRMKEPRRFCLGNITAIAPNIRNAVKITVLLNCCCPSDNYLIISRCEEYQ